MCVYKQNKMRVDFILFKYKNYLLPQENNLKRCKGIWGDVFFLSLNQKYWLAPVYTGNMEIPIC